MLLRWPRLEDEEDDLICHVESENIEYVANPIRSDHRLTIYSISIILETDKEWARKKLPKFLKNKLWVLYQYNASAHSVLSVSRLLVKYIIPMLDYPSYSHDLVLCDLYLSPNICSALKVTRFQSVEDVKGKPKRIMNKLIEEKCRNCFEHWKIHMEHYSDREVELYIFKITTTIL